MNNSIWSKIGNFLRRFFIPLVLFISIPYGLALVINSFLVDRYLRNILKMEFSYYKESVYFLISDNPDMNEQVREDLNRFCVSGIFPFVNGFSNTDDEKKEELEIIKKKIEEYVLNKKEEGLEDIKQELSNYVQYEGKENPEKIIKEFEDYIFTILLFSFYFLEFCLYIILQWKFSSKSIDIEGEDKEKGKRR